MAVLRLDPNGAWSVETSIKVADALSDVLEYLEDPPLGTRAMADVHVRTGVRLATNMCVTAFAEIKEAFTRDAVQAVLSDHHYWGGLRTTPATPATPGSRRTCSPSGSRSRAARPPSPTRPASASRPTARGGVPPPAVARRRRVAAGPGRRGCDAGGRPRLGRSVRASLVGAVLLAVLLGGTAVGA